MLVIFWGIGFLGAILMFVGDMALYYSKQDYVTDGTLRPIIAIMKNLSRRRLYIGGMLGPIAAFVYCIGYYHLVLAINETHQVLGWICFVVNCVGVICGGAYHSHVAYLGLIGRYDDEKVLDEVMHYMDAQKTIAFGLQGIGFLLLAVMLVCNWMLLPRWMVMVSPGILFLLFPITRKLPKGLHMVISGGWTNLISAIYYAIALIVLHFVL